MNDLISGQHAHPATALPSPYPPPLRHNPDIPAGNCIVVGTQEGVHARASRLEGSKVASLRGACPISLSLRTEPVVPAPPIHINTQLYSSEVLCHGYLAKDLHKIRKMPRVS